jgi:hypothetical protein
MFDALDMMDGEWVGLIPAEVMEKISCARIEDVGADRKNDKLR